MMILFVVRRDIIPFQELYLHLLSSRTDEYIIFLLECFFWFGDAVSIHFSDFTYWFLVVMPWRSF